MSPVVILEPHAPPILQFLHGLFSVNPADVDPRSSGDAEQNFIKKQKKPGLTCTKSIFFVNFTDIIFGKCYKID